MVAVVWVLIALLGHLILCVAIVNRLHSTGYDFRLVKLVEQPVALWLLAAPCLWSYLSGSRIWSLACGIDRANPLELAVDPEVSLLTFWPRLFEEAQTAEMMALAYAILCCVVLSVSVAQWAGRRLRSPRSLVQTTSQRIDVAKVLQRPLAGDRVGRWCAALPGNQLFQVEVTRKTLAIPNLPEALEGITVVHLSDLHFTGRIAREYFEYQIELTNQLDADIAVVTGDIVDNWDCFDWLPTTLGQVKAKHGRFFLLGNHDLRRGDPVALRAELARLGWRDVGGACERCDIRGQQIEFYGNELPWFGPAPVVPELRADATRSAASPLDSTRDTKPPFRVLLSHAPDQIGWAIRHQFPLMLAGHTHGGQIVFPLIGPVVAPSRYGVKYAGGVFDERGVVLHVSRGMSGEEPLRWNCPPELPLLTLRRPQV